jgi:SSS family solute:Na+ symporter
MLNSPVPFVVMIIYILVVIALAYQAGFSKKALERKKNQTFEDYMTGGKSRNFFVVLMITVVTFYSGTTFTGRVGFFYNFGVAGLSSVVVCASTGLVMYFLSERIWPLAKKYRLSTLPDIMELRYQSRWVKLLISAIIISFNIIWLITEIRTLGLAVNLASGGSIATKVGSVIAFAIIIVYVMTGGVSSVAKVDVFSACVMLGGSLVVMFFIIGKFFDGNITMMFESARSVASAPFVLQNSGDYNIPYWFSDVVLGSLVMLVYPSNFMSICLAKNVREVKKSSIGTAASGIWLSIYAIFGTAVLGATALGYTINDPEAGILELCSIAGSPLMLGLVCTFILAAALGTLDSTLISLSGLLSNDIITNLLKIKAKEPCIGATGDSVEVITQRVTKDAKAEVFRTRILVLLLGLTGLGFSMTQLPLLTLLTNVATNGMVLITPTIVAGLFWKKVTPQGAIAGMLFSEAVFIVMYAMGIPYVWGGFFLGIPAIIIGTIVLVAVSMLTNSAYYAAHQELKGVYADFYVRGRVAQYIKENMS